MWAVVAAVAAATALTAAVPATGVLDHHARPASGAPASRSADVRAAALPRPPADEEPAATTPAAPTTAPGPTGPVRTESAAAHPGHGKKRTRTQHPGRHHHGKHHHGKHRHKKHRHKQHHQGKHAGKHHHKRHHPGKHHGAAVVPARIRGGDVSWPQCGRDRPMPLGRSFVVVGLTNGPAFQENPCVERQVRWARQHHLHTGAYAVASYPSRPELRRHGRHGPFSPRTLIGRLRNVGFAEARRAVATMHRVGLHPPLVWVDVEPAVRRPWSHRPRLNAAVVHGVVHGYRHAGHRVGFYSTAKLWRQIVGEVRYRAPEWRTAGPSSPHDALARCRQPRSSIQGGRPILAQWWTTAHDHDALCPGSRTPQRLRLFFHKY
jgi:hypothetical protein